MLDKRVIASCIEHTELRPTASCTDIERLCREAIEYHFAAVCVAPTWVAVASDLLAESGVGIVAVNGFPHGNTFPVVKAAEARSSVRAGATDIDMVMQIGRFVAGDVEYVRDDIREVVDAAKTEGPAIVKVILEVCYLSDAEIQLACQVAEQAGADYVKTSTGFGASEKKPKSDYVTLMKNAVGGRLKVKAAGGIGDMETAQELIRAGAARLGSSRSLQILA